jgi:hypothetical protein
MIFFPFGMIVAISGHIIDITFIMCGLGLAYVGS